MMNSRIILWYTLYSYILKITNGNCFHTSFIAIQFSNQPHNTDFDKSICLYSVIGLYMFY